MTHVTTEQADRKIRADTNRDKAGSATRDACNRVEKVLPGDADGDGR